MSGKLSPRSLALLKQCSKKGQYPEHLDYLSLLEQLPKKEELQTNRTQKEEFLLASLRAEVLKDLLAAMNEKKSSEATAAKKKSSKTTITCVCLVIAGSLLAACEGFDSITSILSIFPFSALVVLIAGIGFSLLSVIFFYSFGSIRIANSLNISFGKVPKLLNTYVLQCQTIKAIEEAIESYTLAELDLRELDQLRRLIALLKTHLDSLAAVGSNFNQALHTQNMQTIKTLVSIMGGLLFFGSGYFAGQSVALFFASLVMPLALPTFWPVILFSTIIGLTALSFYYFVEQEGVKKYVSSWFGLEEKKIKLLCDQGSINEKQKLKILDKKVASTALLKKQNEELQRLSPLSAIAGGTEKTDQTSKEPPYHDRIIKTRPEITSTSENTAQRGLAALT
jgi:hypothetical protein